MNIKILSFLSLFFLVFSAGYAQKDTTVYYESNFLKDVEQQDSLIKRLKKALEKTDSTTRDTTITDSVITDSCINDSLAKITPIDSSKIAEKKDSAVAKIKIKEKKPIKVRMSMIDSLSLVYTYKMEQLKKRFKNYKYMGSDTLANPYYFYIFAPPAYYVMPMHQMIGVLSPTFLHHSKSEEGQLQLTEPVTPYPLLESIASALSDVYTTTPQFITLNEEVDLGVSGLRKDVNHEVKPNIKLAEKATQSAEKIEDNYKTDDWDIVVHRPNFWKFKANASLHVMQYYYSENWYKGGENHYSWLASGTMEANYDNKQKITFNNRLEMRLGFQSSKGDSKHKYRSNSDLIRLSNQLGLKATKHWYYSLTLQSWTQFCPSYKKNDEKVYSDFMSPFECNLSLGMKYQIALKRFNLNATISPFSGNLKYVDRKELSPSFGIEKDKHSKFDFGSNVTINYNWNIVKNVSWSGRIFCFTNYDMARIEWENTFNLKINKFLSTKVYIYPRFDDGVQRKEGQSYFQFHEYMSLGFDYTF